MEVRALQLSQHRTLNHLDKNGFGIKMVTKTSAYLPPHWHYAVEILLFLNGTVTCQFSHTRITAHPGEIYIINSHDVHETRCTRDAKYLCIHILPSAMLSYVPDFDQRNFSLIFDPQDEEKAAAFALLRKLLGDILTLYGKHDADGKLECQARLFGIASLLVRHFSTVHPKNDTRQNRSDMNRLEPVLEHIHLHHSEDLTLDDAADMIGLNKAYFCRLFKKNMGISYLQYVNQVRAIAVCRELENSDDTIQEIGERNGFRDPKLMNRFFREIYGCTPSEKRRVFREISSENAIER
jgi:AraC-like DNA-binding protein/quercetin dioxygenase-like cupin family protein